MEELMAAKFWQIQDFNMGATGAPDSDDVLVSNTAPVTTEAEAQQTVRRRMRSHSINKARVEGVRIVDDGGAIVARWTYLDERNARQGGQELDDG
jgi:hypothetical protein